MTSYMDCITDSMSKKQKLSILDGIVEKDADYIFSLRRILIKDPEKRLTLIWEDLENTYGHSFA